MGNLESNTFYDVSVRAICSEGDTSIADNATFHTECAVINVLPYFNDFEDEPTSAYRINAFPRCWVRINDALTNNDFPYVAANDILVIHGDKSLLWKTHPYNSYPDNEYAVLPPIDQSLYDSLISNLSLSFYAKTQDTTAPWPIFIVGVMYNINDTSSFVPVDTITVTPTTTLYTINFANYNGTGKYIAIRCPRTSEDRRSSIDDIFINRTDQWCNPVSNLSASSTESEVTLSWNSNGNSSFTVTLGPNTVNGVTDTFYTFQGLTERTLYNYSVTAECLGGNSLSLLGSIQTGCRPLTYDDLPYFDDFESYGYGRDSLINPCWLRGMTGNVINQWPYASQCVIGEDSVGLWFGAATYYSTWVALPRLDDTVDVSELEVEFLVKRENYQSHITLVTVGVATNIINDSTNNLQYTGFLPVETIDLSNEPRYSLHPVSVRFGDYVGNGKYIIIMASMVPDSMVQNTGSYTYNHFYIDNVNLKIANPCPTVHNVRVTQTTAYSVSLTWDSVATADTFLVYVGTPGFDFASASPYYFYSNSATIDNLNPDNDYELVIVTNCGGSMGDASYPVQFRTLCAPLDILPYYEDFEESEGFTYPSSRVNNLPHCWMYLSNWTSTTTMGFPIVLTNASYAHSGTNLMRFGTENQYTGYIDQIAIMPLTDEVLYPITSLQVSFWIRSATGVNSNIVVGVMSDPTDTGSFVPIRTVYTLTPTNSNPGMYQHYTVGFANYSGPHGHIAFKATMAYGGNNPCIDDIVVEEIPNSCPDISSIHYETTASAAFLTWDYNIEFGSPVGFNVNYRYAGDTSETPTNIYTTEPQLIITDLGSDSAYWVSVEAICGELTGTAGTTTFNTQGIPCAYRDTIGTPVDTITLGNPGTGYTQVVPLSGGNLYSYCQQLFRAEEIPISEPTSISGIAFEYYNAAPTPLPMTTVNCSIYLAHTDRPHMFVGDTSFVPYSQLQLVYVGPLDFPTNGWHYVQFNQGHFHYDGHSNLCLAVVDNSGTTFNSYYSFRYEALLNGDNIGIPVTLRSIRWGSTAVPYTPIDMDQHPTSYSWSNYRTNTRFIIGGAGDCIDWATCLPPFVTVDSSTIGEYRFLWIPGYQESSWDMDYRILGYEDTSSWTNILTETNLNEYTILMSDLQYDTRYEFRVTANCNDTTLSSSIIFYTPCTYISIPFTYGFEGLPTGSSTEPANIHCWHHLNDAGIYNGHPIITSGAHTGNRGLGFGASAGSYYSNYQAIVLPSLDISTEAINSLYLNFWARSATNEDPPILLVGVMTNPNDISTFYTVDSVFIDPSITVWDRFEVSFENYNGDGQYIAIRANRPSLGYWTATIDDITLSYEPMCRRVNNIVFRDVTTDSATVSWTRGGNETLWELTIGDSIYYLTDTVYTVHGLENDTVYTVSIRAICGEGDTSSIWSNSFHTPCYLLSSLPLINDFENEPYYQLHTTSHIEAFPACWRRVNDIPTNNNSGGRPYIRNTGISGIHGTNSMYWELTYEYNKLFVVLPPVDKSVYNISDLYLLFYARTLSSEPGASFLIGVMNHDSDTANFIPVDTITPTRDATLYTVSFACLGNGSADNYNGTGNYIAIRGSRPNYNRELLLDDVVLTDRICYPVSHLRASSTDTSVTLVWSPENNSSFTAVLGNDTVRGITDTFYTFHPLANTTLYNYAVAAECEGSSDSVAENNHTLSSIFQTGSIQTECPPLTMNDIPYFEDFESYAYGYDTTISPCWRRGSVPSIFSSKPYASHLYIGEDTVGLNMSVSSSSYRWVALPRLDISIDITRLEVNFLIKRPDSGYLPIPSTRLIVGVAEDVTWYSGYLPAASMEPTAPSYAYTYSGLVPVDTIDLSDEPVSSLHSVTVRFNNYTGNGRYIVFYAPSPESGMPNNGFDLDNIELRLAAPCPTPHNVRITGTTSDNVFVTWSSDNGSDQWLVYIGEPGFELGNVAPYIVTDSVTQIGGLTPNTDYEMVIVANCGGNEGYPSYPVPFHTKCAPIDTLPFFEDFESVAGIPSYTTYTNVNTMPDCWLRHNTSITYSVRGAPLVHNDPANAHSGNNTMHLITCGDSNQCSDQYAIMPLTDSILYPARGLQVSFWIRSAHYYYNSFVVVGVMSDPYDPATFVALDSIYTNSSTTYSYHMVSMAGYQGPHGYIAFKAPMRTPGLNTSNRPYIDDITLDKRPCSLVEDMHIAYTTTDSIVIAWSDSSSTNGVWYLEYDTINFTPGNGTRTPIHVFDTMYTMTDLTPNTTYHIYLYPDCLDSAGHHYISATTDTLPEPPLSCPREKKPSAPLSIRRSMTVFWPSSPPIALASVGLLAATKANGKSLTPLHQ